MVRTEISEPLDVAATTCVKTMSTATGELQRCKRFCKHMFQIVNAEPLQG